MTAKWNRHVIVLLLFITSTSWYSRCGAGQCYQHPVKHCWWVTNFMLLCFIQCGFSTLMYTAEGEKNKKLKNFQSSLFVSTHKWNLLNLIWEMLMQSLDWFYVLTWSLKMFWCWFVSSESVWIKNTHVSFMLLRLDFCKWSTKFE